MKIRNYMLGTDFSHHNEIDLQYCGQQGFIFLKATEGKSMFDNNMDNDLREIENNYWGTPPFIGFYHYAHPEFNSAKTESNFFLERIKPHIGNCMCALDFEGVALHVHDNEMWALEWLHNVQSQTGARPIFYVQASAVELFPKIIENGFPLWVACYSQESRISRYPKAMEKATFIQITSHPFDIDIFKGTPVDMAKIIQGR